ncbi:hypothetical protein RHGRI_002639 [Rhododendron griersonianum]|uniref:MLO-like protein n=1 Tax=Rhododendron griersonianum TaxID=479676 RepID=A0AAV6LQI3_9ERIC|nr:hypothetical protein RHGRI_002639 [Rhododendron griersonianum]
MLLGFISLLLTVFQNVITKICVNKGVIHHLLPCKLPSSESESEGEPSSNSTEITSHIGRLLAEGSQVTGYCTAKNKVQLVSVEALHHLHIFIFVLAIVHVTFNALTVVFGGAKIREWKHWEDSIAKENYDTEKVLGPRITDVHQHDFIRGRFWGIGKNSAFLGWLHSFLKQFYGSVTKSDYVALRLGFIMTHCRGNPKFNFHKYMIRALEDDFKKVVGVRQVIAEISFVIAKAPHCFFYFNIQFCFSPIMWVNVAFDWLQLLLLAVGTKLEHVISQLAHEVAEKHVAIEGDLVVTPSDNHFWFHRPRIVLYLIHFILFQNAFEIAFFFWIWVQYGFDSCIMGQVHFIVPRLVIGVIIQVLCSYSTLPLYAIVTQMGSTFKKSIFEEHVQVGLVGWAQKVKKKKAANNGSRDGNSSSTDGSTARIQLGRVTGKESARGGDSAHN